MGSGREMGRDTEIDRKRGSEGEGWERGGENGGGESQSGRKPRERMRDWEKGEYRLGVRELRRGERKTGKEKVREGENKGRREGNA